MSVFTVPGPGQTLDSDSGNNPVVLTGILDAPLEVYSFDPDGMISLSVLVMSFVLGILFFLVQTALGSASRITVGEENRKRNFWEKGSEETALSWRIFERRCWASGIFCHLAFLISSTSLFLDQRLGSIPLQLSIFVPVILVCQFLFFDMFIRQLAIRYPDYVLKWLSDTAWIFSFPLQPVFRILYSVKHGIEPDESRLKYFTREREFRLLPHISEVDQIVEEGAAELMDSVREFMGSTAIDIMTPRTEIEGIEKNATPEDIRELLQDTAFSRIVVYKDNLDHIEGFLLAKEVLLNSDRNPMEFLRRPVVTDSSTRLSDLLRILKRKKTYLAVVSDEYGGTSGILTLQDLFMAVMGNRLEDAGDTQSLWIEQEDDAYLLSGRVEIWEANQEMGTQLDEKTARTIGGLIMHLQGRLPDEGEKLEDGSGVFEILKIENNRVEVVRFVPGVSDKSENAEESPEVVF